MNKKKISIISTIVIIGVGALSYTAYAQYQKKSKINTFKTDLESFQQKTKNSIMSKDENSEVNSLISECNKIVDTSNINAIPEMENKLNSELNEIKKENETLIANQIKEVSSLNTSKLSDKDDITKKLNDIKSLESKGEFASANQELIKLKEHINSENESIEKKEQEEAKKKVEEEKKKQEKEMQKYTLSNSELIKLFIYANSDTIYSEGKSNLDLEYKKQLEFQKKVDDIMQSRNLSPKDALFYLLESNEKTSNRGYIHPLSTSPVYIINNDYIYYFEFDCADRERLYIDSNKKICTMEEIKNAYNKGILYEYNDGKKVKVEIEPQFNGHVIY
ncbi:MAG: hypothetical protein E7J35_05490 [Veillonella sp.]|uniref:hypothetical protein n=1 Tax=Veillonella sp. TaxID=1926307 RepID=UPI0028FE9270|nr:hypothetical protein [Veillonella sp.]MDU2663368.1 hypothetical protein [Clostridium perfringens]MDU7927991.1 hypothetical protein [Veillonella sp.]MDU7955046.1 hypothetical protein [Clostridium perfringens]MDU7962792.1 hypothetical protein [Clostridium perfringens]